MESGSNWDLVCMIVNLRDPIRLMHSVCHYFWSWKILKLYFAQSTSTHPHTHSPHPHTKWNVTLVREWVCFCFNLNKDWNPSKALSNPFSNVTYRKRHYNRHVNATKSYLHFDRIAGDARCFFFRISFVCYCFRMSCFFMKIELLQLQTWT